MAAFTIECINEDRILKNKYGIYSKKELISQLQNGHFTVEEFGDIYKLKSYQMVHILRVLEIDFRNNVNDTRILDSTISPSVHQVLLGTLLGDAFMTSSKCYQLGHGPSQFDYFYHVAERLHPFIATVGDKDTECSTEKSFIFWTYRHSVFLDYFQKFYSAGKKKKLILASSVYDLNDEGLAYWYMDDGRHGYNYPDLCVGNISINEIVILINLLKNKFNIDCTYHFQSIPNGYYHIHVSANSRNHFFELISPHIIPSMRYKITGDPFPQIKFNPENIIIRHKQLCNTAGRVIRYSGDSTIEKAIECLKKDSIKDQYMTNILNAINNNTQISRTHVREMPSDETLKEMLLRGMTDNTIAKELGFGRNRIATIRRSLGLSRRSCRIPQSTNDRLIELFKIPGMTISRALPEIHLSYYKVKDWVEQNKIVLIPPIPSNTIQDELEKNSDNSAEKLDSFTCHQHIMKSQYLKEDLDKLSFDPAIMPITDYVFSKEDYSDELKKFLEKYEWLRSLGASPKWCFTMRLNGHLAGLQILNEPTSYSKLMGQETPIYECLVQRGCTVSWAHPHLGSKMLMTSIHWMVDNTEKRLFEGYADNAAKEVGIIYQACNFKYLGNNFGVRALFKHPTYRNGREFSEHSLKRTGTFLWWCRNNNVVVESSWIKENGFKDIRAVPIDIRKRWSDWRHQIISESVIIESSPKGKYALVVGRDRREQALLDSLFKTTIYPYPKRNK